jgi:hypothetical protein
VPVDRRDNRGKEPDEPVMPLTRGDSRDHRPDLNQVRLDLMVEHQAGISVLIKPLSGHTQSIHIDIGTHRLLLAQNWDGISANLTVPILYGLI